MAGPSSARRRKSAALVLLVSAQFVVMLDTSIVNVALPSIQAQLGLDQAALTWVVNSYVLIFGGLLLMAGRLTDMLGGRRMFIGGSMLFAMGSLIAALATDQGLLMAGRIVQGAGAACLSPAAMSLILVNFPGPDRARAMSTWGAASALGAATGVMAGGLLVGTFGWSSVFFVTLPISVAAAAVARKLLDEEARGTRRRFDALGALTISGAVVALVRGVLDAAHHGLSSTGVMVSLVWSTLLLVAFIAAERRAVDPLVPLSLFRSRAFSTGVGLAVLGGAARASSFVLIALYLQQALAMAPQRAGLAMVPMSVAGFVFSLALLPRIVRAFGAPRSLVVGLIVLASGQVWLAAAPREGGYAVSVLPGLLLVAIGVALSFTPTTMVIAEAVPPSHPGLASGLSGSATQVGAALGNATFTAIGVALGGGGAAVVGASGFAAAFAGAAIISLATAALGATVARPAAIRATSR